MQKLITALFASAFTALVVVLAFILRPLTQSITLDYPTLNAVFGYVVLIEQGSTPVYTALGDNSANEMQELAIAFTTIIGVGLSTFNLRSSIGIERTARLLEAVALKLAPPVTP